MLKLLGLIVSSPFKLWGFIKAKPQLTLSYAMIGCILVMAVLIAHQWGQKKMAEVRLSQAETNIANLNTENGQIRHDLNNEKNINLLQQDRIEFLENQRLIDEAALSNLRNDNVRITANDKKSRERISNLERNNEKVREYLKQPLPDELKCLLNNTCPKEPDGNGNKSGGKDRTSSASVRINTSMRTASQ